MSLEPKLKLNIILYNYDFKAKEEQGYEKHTYITPTLHLKNRNQKFISWYYIYTQ